MPVQIRLILAFFLIALNSLSAKPEATRIELYFGIAQGYYLIGNLKGASKSVEQMLKLDPDYIPALALNTRILLDQGKPEQALKSAEHALTLEPENPENQLLKALILGNLDRRKEAAHIAESVVQSTPPQSKHHRVASKLLGLLLMAEGDLDKATEVLNQSYLNNPETAQSNRALAGEAFLQKADSALSKNNFDAALEAIDEALALLDPSTSDTDFQQRIQLNKLRARTLTQAGRTIEASKTLQQVLIQQPDDLEALVTLASLYTSTHQWESIQQFILPSIAENPELQDITLYLEGRVALAKGRAGTARQAFESALRFIPDGINSLRASIEFYQGICLLEMDRTEEGDLKILHSLESGFRPETSDEILPASRSLLRAEEASQAITLLEALTLTYEKPPADAWNLLGRAHLVNDVSTLALSAFNQSLKLQPDQPDTLALRGSLLRKIGDLEGALTDFRSALESNPENPALSYSLGLTHLQLGNLDQAEQWIRKSLKKLPNDPGIHLLHALLVYVTEERTHMRTSLEIYNTLVPEKRNESALYLAYIRTAETDPRLAIETLSKQVKSSNATPLLRNFLAYVSGTLNRKAILDAAGYAETPEIAQKQLCAAAYWLAQHAYVHHDFEETIELLTLAIKIGSPDYPEYQFAKWQLNSDLWTEINPL